MDGLVFAVQRHGTAHGVVYLELEIRQDLLGDDASALAIAYRTTGDPELRALGEAIFLENKSGFLENGSYSWLHSMGEVLEEGE